MLSYHLTIKLRMRIDLDKTNLFVLGILLFSSYVFGQNTMRNVALDHNIIGTYGEGHFGGGVSFVDFNSDGWDDLTFASQAGDSLYFYLNENGAFHKIPSLVDNVEEAKQILWVDIDNDGDLDLYVSAFNGINRLYRNKGNLELQDITESSGLLLEADATHGVCFGDVDNDGLLDLYVSNYFGVLGHTNLIYRNLGNGVFQDYTLYSGVGAGDNPTLVSSFIDYNNDGLQDIYVCSDKYEYPNLLYKNLGGWRFKEVSAETGTNCYMDAMNIGYADFDRDADFDIYITNTVLGGNKLLQNNSNNHYADIADSLELDIHNVGWAANFVDIDNDQDLDLYICHNRTTLDDHNRLYFNKGDGSFFEGFLDGMDGDTLESYSSAVGDFNNDGFPDIAINNAGVSNFQLLENENDTGNFINIKFKGNQSNLYGKGNHLTLDADGIRQVAYVLCGTGYKTQNSNIVHFGLGSNAKIDSLKVKWLSGIVDRFYNISVNQTLAVNEGSHSSYYDIQIDETICDNDSYMLFDSLLTETGEYTLSGVSSSGLDSIVTINLEVIKSEVLELNETICSGESITIGNYTTDVPGIHEIKLLSGAGCDSIILLDLIVEAFAEMRSFQICAGEYLLIEEDSLFNTGSYEYSYPSQNGCDSLIVVDLLVQPDTLYLEEISICQGDTLQYYGLDITEEGEFEIELQDASGCDSIIMLEVVVHEVFFQLEEIAVMQGTVFESIEILADTSFSINLTSINGCDSIIQVDASIISGLENLDIKNEISVYPNPFRQNFNLEYLGDWDDVELIRIYDVKGKVVKTIINDMYDIRNNKIDINAQSFLPGIYFLNLTIKNQNVLIKILKTY